MKVIGSAKSELAEVVMHAALRFVGEYPALIGRLRLARLLGGYQHGLDENQVPACEMYEVASGWRIGQIIELIDSGIQGGLLVRTPGARPALVLTRAGFRALEVLECDRPIDHNEKSWV